MPLVKFLQPEKVGRSTHSVGSILQLEEETVQQLEALGASRGKPIIKRLGRQEITNSLPAGTVPDVGEQVLIRNADME